MNTKRVAIVGATGGIGAALGIALKAAPDVACVYGLARSPAEILGDAADQTLQCDITKESEIAAAFDVISADGPLDVCVVATGLLHDKNLQPEKDWRHLDVDRLTRNFQINAIGPALIAKHALPVMRQDGQTPAVFAALSARVGSISDNRIGGWYGYRASKAALNMMIACLAIEAARKRNPTICLGVHPGTVATDLSAPFRSSTRPGQVVAPAEAAANIWRVISNASPTDSGKLLAWDGAIIPF